MDLSCSRPEPNKFKHFKRQFGRFTLKRHCFHTVKSHFEMSLKNHIFFARVTPGNSACIDRNNHLDWSPIYRCFACALRSLFD